MNAIAPAPKRAFGTGTVSPQTSGKWRYRLPGGHTERGGFDTRPEAEAALESALAGRDWKLIELRKLVKRAARLAQEIDADLGAITRTARTELLIDNARMRRATERAALAAADEKGARDR